MHACEMLLDLMKEKERRIGVRVPVDIDGSDRMDGSDRWNIQSSLLCAYVRTYWLVRQVMIRQTGAGGRQIERRLRARARVSITTRSIGFRLCMHA